MFLNKLLINTVSLMRVCKSKSPHSIIQRALTIECLKSRSVLKVSGEESSDFMQGLITNDMQHLEDGACSMYTMFLNQKGRVMYDAIIYRTPVRNDFIIECDLAATEPLRKHISMFRIRRKIAVDNLANDVNVWVVFHPVDINDNSSDGDKSHAGRIVPCNALNELQSASVKNSAVVEISPDFGNKHNVIVCRDPRLAALGNRIIAPKTVDLIKIAAEEIGTVMNDQQSNYKALRYKLGVGEGLEDLPPGNCFPLEANCDYLHGVSFHKGCYIGQELTARTHHTGVVRKRLMPIVFDEQPTTPFVPDSPIHHGNSCSRPIGKLRGAENNSGLALLRIAEALEAEKLKVLNVSAQTMKPAWWPQEAPKDRVSAGKDTMS